MTDELAAVLPDWVPWVGPALALVVLTGIYLWVRIVVVDGSFRSISADAPWTERARGVHVARTGAAVSVLVLPIIGVASALTFVGPMSPVPRTTAALGLAALGALGGLLDSAAVDRRIFGPSEAGFAHSVSGPLIGYLPALALAALGWFAPSEMTSWWMVPWLLAVLLVVHAWLRAPLLLVHTPLADDADARAAGIVEAAASALDISVSRTVEFHTRQPNAFAFPWLGVVAFTSGLLEALDDDELEAITHHELAHLRESAGLTRLRQSQLYALVPIAATRPLIDMFGIVGPLVALLILVGVTEVVRRRGLAAEHDSDSAAVDAIHHSAVYGSALEKTYRIGLIPVVLRRATHGHLHERLATAGVEPEFEVPSPPSRLRPLVAVVGGVVTIVAAVFSPWVAYLASGNDAEAFHQFGAAIPLYGSSSLEDLAFDAELDRRWGDAAVLYEAAADARPSDVFLRSEAVRLWAFAGDCARAGASAEALDPALHAEDVRYAEDLIEWCELTGGRATTG